MKTSVRILLLLFLSLSLSVSLSFGQNISQKTPLDKQIPVKIDKNLLPTGFMAGLQIRLFTHTGNNDKSTRDFTYRMDTALVYSNGTNPQRYIYTYDSAGNKIATYNELTTNGKWVYVSKDTATYDSVGNQLSDLSKIWENGNWANSSLNLNTYTVNHNVVSQISKVWNGSGWNYSDSTHFSYNANNNKVASFHAIWVDSLSTWVSSSFNIFTYDSVGNLQLSLNEQWQDSLWMDNQQVTYAYDSASNLILGLVQSWGDTNWINVYQESYIYDSAKNRLSYIGEIWNDSVWVNDQRYHYSYNQFGWLETGIGENWKDSTWVYYEKGQYTYDTYGGVESYLYQQWENDSAWGNISLSQYNYDSVGNAYIGNYFAMDSTGTWTQNNDGVLQIYYNYSSAVAYFTGYQVEVKYNSPLSTGVSSMKGHVTQFSFVPNPAVNHTTIRFGLDARERIGVNLYSLTGERLATIFQGELNKGIYRFKVPTAQLPSGVYLATLSSGRFTKTIKLVVRK